MKNKNLIVIFLSGVYQYLIPMLLYVLLPPPLPLLSAGGEVFV